MTEALGGLGQLQAERADAFLDCGHPPRMPTRHFVPARTMPDPRGHTVRRERVTALRMGGRGGDAAARELSRR